jgi:hypothetical protein
MSIYEHPSSHARTHTHTHTQETKNLLPHGELGRKPWDPPRNAEDKDDYAARRQCQGVLRYLREEREIHQVYMYMACIYVYMAYMWHVYMYLYIYLYIHVHTSIYIHVHI